MFYTRFVEAGFFHPALAVRAGVIESAGCFHQHVEADQKRRDALAAIIVDQHFISDERAARGKGVVRLLNEGLLGFEVPIMQHVAHDDHVHLGQGIGEEASRLETQAILKAVRGGVFLEDGFDLRQVEADAVQVRLRRGDLHRRAALGAADVGEGLVILPGKLLRHGGGAQER